MIAHARDFHFRSGEIEIRWNNEEMLAARGQHFVGDGGATQKRIINTIGFKLLEAEGACGVGLRIKIDK